MSKGLETINKNEVLIVLIIFMFIIGISAVLIIFFTQKNMSNYVYYTNCYKPVSDYAIESDKTSDSVLYNCGLNNNNRCCRKANNLSDAINYAKFKDAQKFTYDEKTNMTCHLDHRNTNYSDKPNSHILTKQVHSYNQDSQTGDITLKEEPTIVKTNLDTSAVSSSVTISPFSTNSRSGNNTVSTGGSGGSSSSGGGYSGGSGGY